MVNPQEAGNTNLAEIQQVKQTTLKEIQSVQAITDVLSRQTAIDNLRSQYLTELSTVGFAATEVVSHYESARDIRGVLTQAVDVKKTLVKVLEGVKAGIIKPLPTSSVIIGELAARDEQLTDISSSYLQPILEKYINQEDITFSKSGQPLTQFEKDFRELKANYSTAAQFLGQIIKDKSGELTNVSQNDILMQLGLGLDNKGKIVIPEEEERKKTQRDEEELRKKQIDRIKAQSDEATPEDWDRLEEIQNIMNKATEKINASFATEKDENVNKLFQKDRDLIKLFYHGDTTISIDEIRTIFRRHNIPLELVDEYRDLITKINSLKLEPISFMTDPEFKRLINEANKLFDINDKKFQNEFLISGPDNKPLLMTREGRLKFKNLITKYYNFGLQRIHQTQSEQFAKAQQGSEQTRYYFGDLHGIITNACEGLKTLYSNDREAQRFFTDMSAAYQARIMTWAETFHDLPLYARNAESFEKWPEFLGYLFPSQLGEIFDPEDRFMEMVRDEITTYTKRRMVLNGNKYPHDLLSGEYKKEGVRYGFRFTEDVKDIIERRMRALGMWEKNPDPDREWQLERAMVYAPGIGIASLIDVEVRSTAEPVTDFEGIDPIMAKFSAKHNWAMGRGSPFAGLKPAKYMLAMDVDVFPEKKGFFSRLTHKKPWVPKEFVDKVDKQVAKYGGEVYSQLFDRGGKYQELLNMVNFAPSLISRSGWRMRPIRDELYGKMNEQWKIDMAGKDAPEIWRTWTRKDWNKVWDLSLKEYGNASLWWFINSGPERLNNSMKRLLKDRLGTNDEVSLKFPEYDSGELALDRKFNINIDGQEKEMNFLEIKIMQMNQLRGETFYRYLRRNPGDFFLSLSQLVPDLANLYQNQKLANAGLKSWELNDVFLTKEQLHERYGRVKTELEYEQIEAKQNAIMKRWEKVGFTTLKQLNKWMCDQINEGKFKDVQEFIRVIEEESGTASERMRNKNNDLERQILDLTIKRDNEGNPDKKDKLTQEIVKKREQKRLYTTPEDFVIDSKANADPKTKEDAKKISAAIFDPNGLIKILTGKEYTALKADENGYLDNFGDYDKINLDNFFYQMGQAWTLKQGDTNPYSADFNHFAVYSKLGQPGEDLVKRYVGDAVSQSKVLENLAHLDNLLLEASHGGNFEEIFKLHKDLFMMLQGIISKEYAWRANNIMASIVTQFFMEHSDLRTSFIPFPMTMLARTMMGRSVSLSKLLSGNMQAYTMDQNAIKTYFRELSYVMDVIPHKGAYSHEQLETAFDAKSDTYIFGDFAPNFLLFLAMFLFWTYIKKAFSESEGKKQ